MFVFRVRGAGTAAVNMCLVASGCVEAYYEIGIHVWDIAAGSLIVSEAGGVLMDVNGKSTPTAPCMLLHTCRFCQRHVFAQGEAWT